jgi:putative MATE family efflux protein
MVYNFGSAIVRATGDTKRPLIILASTGLVNVALNLILVIVFHMGVSGVAIATITAQYLSAIMIVIHLTKLDNACRIRFSKLRIHKIELFKILRIGLPAGIQNSLFSVSNVIIQSTVNSFGSVVLAGNSAAISLGGFVYTTMHSINQSALNFTGQNYGARRFDNIRKIAWICLGAVAVLGLIAGGTVTLLGKPLLGIYIKDSPESIAYGISRLWIVVFPYFFCGMMDVTTGLLRGMGSSLSPMIISVLGVCGIRLGWIFWVMPLNHTPEMLYISYPLSWLATFLAQYVTFRISLHRKKTRLNRKIQQQAVREI